MKNFLTITVGVLILLCIIGAVLLFGPFRGMLSPATQSQVDSFIPDYFKGNRGGQGPIENPLPVPTTLPGSDMPTKPSATTLWTLPGQQGKELRVLPFVVSSSTLSEPPSRDTLLAGGIMGSTSPYNLLYYAEDQSFVITLLKEPLGETRRAAEVDLVKKLGLTESDACSLKYVVLVPYKVNTFYSGKNLGFSFCPKATQL